LLYNVSISLAAASELAASRVQISCSECRQLATTCKCTNVISLPQKKIVSHNVTSTY